MNAIAELYPKFHLGKGQKSPTAFTPGMFLLPGYFWKGWNIVRFGVPILFGGFVYEPVDEDLYRYSKNFSLPDPRRTQVPNELL